MVKSMNTKVDLSIKATSFFRITSYGDVLIGDKAFEYYNEKNTNDYIQIPWTQINYIAASVMFKGKIISRFAIFLKDGHNLSFSTRDNKLVLRTISKYISKDKLVRSYTFFEIITKGIRSLLKKSWY